MYMYIFAGAFLLGAIVFVIKFLIDSKKTNKSQAVNTQQASQEPEIIIVVEDEQKKDGLNNKAKKDVVIAVILMALCEVCLLLVKYVTDF